MKLLSTTTTLTILNTAIFASSAMATTTTSSSPAAPLEQQQQHQHHRRSSNSNNSNSHYPVRPIYQFPNNATWIENVAVRPNGNLLVTLLSPAAELHEIVPPASPSTLNTTTNRLVHRFDGYQGLLGIAETAPDVFAVVAGNYSTGSGSTPAWALWEVDFSSAGDVGTDAEATAAVTVSSLVPSVANASVLNGLTTLRQSSSSSSSSSSSDTDTERQQLFVSDSAAGRILRTTIAGSGGGNLSSSSYSSSSPPSSAATSVAITTFLSDDHTTPPPNNSTSSSTTTTSVNGVRYRPEDGYLYFTNTARELFCRVRVDIDDDDENDDDGSDATTTTTAGAEEVEVEVLAEGLFKGDDFAVRWEEREGGVVAYVADGVDGGVARVVVVGGGDGGAAKEKETLAVGERPTSVGFGRRVGADGDVDVDVDVLYVVTRDGKVLAVDVGGS
ncbi:six-bladed beta-propeller-like protein [Diplodia corticola]|uniref:Six-bladed beta-propeller-like protein n=1 Tax=Diplodia corticola TaxID=236234 RepID=A0A1J9RKS3_9PEZI|nr:six-bladed beta-propeller-like protein [Diplodia corticola]OJD29119.1 six-bladed beta-propeller-like protein [Diplodia corticola]